MLQCSCYITTIHSFNIHLLSKNYVHSICQAIHQWWIIHASWPGEDQSLQWRRGSCQILLQRVKCDSTATWRVAGAQRKAWVIVCKGSWMVKSYLPRKKRDEDREGHLLLKSPDRKMIWTVLGEPYSLSRTMAKKRQCSKTSQLCFLLLQESSVLLKRKHGLRFSGR